MARICIITPGQLGSNPRVVKEASALAEAGHAVVVICTKVLAAVEARDRAVMATARFAVKRIAFGTSPGWWIDRLLQIIAARLFGLVPANAFAELALSPMMRRLANAARREPADLYIAHYPPALPAAARAAVHFNARFAFDAEDFHTGELPIEADDSTEVRIISAIERRHLSNAAYVTAASPGIADAYAGAYRIAQPTVVLNTFPKASAAPVPASGAATPAPSMYWFSQTLGPGRGIETAIEAIALSRSKPHLHLRGTSSANYAATLADLATRLGIADRVHLLDPIQPDLLERAGTAYAIGYVGELAETQNRQIALTNKLFSYLSSGLAIVASDITAHRAIAPELGGAMKLFPHGNAIALADRLDEWLSDPHALQAAREQAWALGQDRYCWETDKTILLRQIGSVLP
jgi:glycosyltransferase involved in cell wall biosynthesis